MNTIIKSTILILPLNLAFTSCNESSAQEEHPQVAKPKVIDIEGDTVIKLDEGEAITVIQNKKDGRMFAIGNIDGVLSATQLEKGGKTPITVKLNSADKAEVWTEREKLLIYIDDDGDGLVDRRLDKTGIYKVKKIEWEKVEIKK